MNILDLLNEIIEKKKIQFIVEELCVSKYSIKKWLKYKKIPKLYHIQLLRLNNMAIKNKNFTHTEKSQFYTPTTTAKLCIQYLLDVMRDLNEHQEHFTFIDPCVGTGSFYNQLPEKKVGMDIEPKIQSKNVLHQNYLDFNPEKNKRYVIVSNPPFGVRGNLALKFINHSYEINAEFVAFILPSMFAQSGRGCIGRRIKNFNLVFNKELPNVFLEPCGTIKHYNVVFQIWSRNHKKVEYSNFFEPPRKNENFEIYSLSIGKNGNRNVKYLDKCHLYLPSSCYEKDMKLYKKFDELPGKRGYGIIFNDKNHIKHMENFTNWQNVCLKSTVAYNLNIAIISREISRFYETINNVH